MLTAICELRASGSGSMPDPRNP